MNNIYLYIYIYISNISHNDMFIYNIIRDIGNVFVHKTIKNKKWSQPKILFRHKSIWFQWKYTCRYIIKLLVFNNLSK